MIDICLLILKLLFGFRPKALVRIKIGPDTLQEISSDIGSVHYTTKIVTLIFNSEFIILKSPPLGFSYFLLKNNCSTVANPITKKQPMALYQRKPISIGIPNSESPFFQ